MYQTPYTSLAVVGEILRLQCILGGYPLPSYRWYKDGKDATLVGFMFIDDIVCFLLVTQHKHNQHGNDSRNQPCHK